MAYNPTNTNGQATMANSAPVVVASDQVIPIAIMDIVKSGTVTNGQISVAIPVSGHAGLGITFSGTWSGSVSVGGSTDLGVQYTSIGLAALSGGPRSLTVSSNGAYEGNAAGLTHIKIDATGVSSGTVSYALVLTEASRIIRIWSTDPSNVLTTSNIKDSSGNTITALSGAVYVLPQATENHLGSIGGTSSRKTSALTVTAASAYSTGNVVGSLSTVANVSRINAGTATIQNVIINSKSNQTAQFDVIFFNANPTNSTFTDKTALAVAVADFDKVIGVAHVTDWTNLGTTSLGQSLNPGIIFNAGVGSTSIYAVVATRGAPTFTATSDLTLSFSVFQD